MGFGTGTQTEQPAEAAPTDTAEPTPAGLPEVTTPDPAPPAQEPSEAAPSSPSQGDGSEIQGTTTDPGASPAEPPAWAAASDVEAVLAVESVSKRVSELKTEATETGRRNAQSQIQPSVQANQQRLDQLNGGIQNILRSWNKIVKSGTLTQEEASEIIEENRGTFEALAKYDLERGRWEGRGEWIGLAGQIDPAITAEFQPRFDALMNNLDDPTFTSDFLKAVGKAVADPVRTELTEAKANVARLEDEARKAGRTTNPSPPNLGGVGGSVPTIPADESERLSRLAFGSDSNGTPPTDADKAWLAERN